MVLRWSYVATEKLVSLGCVLVAADLPRTVCLAG